MGFETIRYYLIINAIKDLYCAVLREIATTCDYAVTNCHGIYFPHFQSEIIAKMPSPFELKLISIRPLRLVANCDYDRRRRNIANPLKPVARSERAEGSGT